MLRNEPLLFDAVDHDSYAPRPQIERKLLDAVETDRGVLITGPSGSGKSTLLNWLTAHLRGQRRSVGRVDGAVIDSSLALLEAIRVALLADADRAGRTEERLQQAPVLNALTEPVQLQELARHLGATKPSVVLIDNLWSPVVIRQVFGGLRDLLWASRHTFVVTSLHQNQATFLEPPADAFFRRRIQVPDFNGAEIERLIELSELPHAAATERIEGQPRQVRSLVSALLTATSHPPGLDLRLPGDLSPSARELWRDVVLLDRPVTPFDEALRERTGRAPTTLRRQLNELASAGLLEKINDRTGQPGRPQVKYQPQRELVA